MPNSEIFDDIWYQPKKNNHAFCKGDTLPTSESHPTEQRNEQYEIPKKPFNQKLFRIQRAIETLEDPNPLVMKHQYSIGIVLTGLYEALQVSAEQSARMKLIQSQRERVVESKEYARVS